MEERECGCHVSPDFKDELAKSIVLVFVFHDVLWDLGSDWWTRSSKDDELLLFEGGCWFLEDKRQPKYSMAKLCL
jgi:hypothetical protein